MYNYGNIYTGGFSVKYGFGVDLGGTTVKIAFFDELGTMLSKWEIPTNTADEGCHILPDIAVSIHGYLRDNRIDRSSIIGVGIGVPGAVLPSGVVNKCINLGWGKFDITSEFSRLVGFPVKAGNDANVAALGEFWKGGGRNAHSMVMVTLGTGVGGGIVIDGKLLAGEHGAGAEIGHMVINREETVRCNCGKYGCVEQYCSATGIVRVAHKIMADSPLDSPLRRIEPLTCKDIFDCGKDNDPLALEILDAVYRYMGEFLANVCIVADPEIVVIGGGVSKAGQILLDGIRPYFDRYIFHASNSIEFTLATLGNDAGAYGAFKLVLDQQQ